MRHPLPLPEPEVGVSVCLGKEVRVMMSRAQTQRTCRGEALGRNWVPREMSLVSQEPQWELSTVVKKIKAGAPGRLSPFSI